MPGQFLLLYLCLGHSRERGTDAGGQSRSDPTQYCQSSVMVGLELCSGGPTVSSWSYTVKAHSEA